MFKIYDGRETFYQWDINQKLIVEDDSITEVHFSNRTNSYSLVCDIQNEGDLRVVSVPNVLLQTNWPIRVYAYRKDHTEVSEIFKVIEKDKPEDYIYTPDEVKTWEELNNRITELEKPAESVLYTTQELTEEQKAQARQNIGSFDIFDLPNLIKFNVKSKAIFGDKIVEGQVFALNDFQPIDINTADTETVEAWRTLYHTFSINNMQTQLGNTDLYMALAFLIDKNMFGENFYSTHIYSNCAWFGCNHKFMKFYSWAESDPAQKVLSGFIYDLEKSVGTFKYKALTNEIEYFSYSYPLTASADTSTNGNKMMGQINMRADPANDMEIATKHYVDNSIATTSVLHTTQSLTEEQQAQARANIGAQNLYNGLTPVSYSCTDGTYSVSDTVYLESGNIISPVDTVSSDVRLAFRFINSWNIPTRLDVWKDDIKKYKLLIDNGYLENNTIWYSKPDKKYKKQIRFGTNSRLGNYIIFNFNYNYEVVGQLVYYVDTDTISTGTDTYLNRKLSRDINNVLSYSAIKLASDPTEPMQIATKQYVDNAPIKQASATELGGVKADSAEATDTQPVRIGVDGKLYTAPGGIHLIARVVTEANATSIEVTGLSTTSEVLSLRIYNQGSNCGGGLDITVNGVQKTGFGGTNQGTTTDKALVRAWLYRDGDILYGRSRMANEGTNVYEWPEMGEITSITVGSHYNDGTTKYFQTGTIFEIYEGVYPNVQ